MHYRIFLASIRSTRKGRAVIIVALVILPALIDTAVALILPVGGRPFYMSRKLAVGYAVGLPMLGMYLVIYYFILLYFKTLGAVKLPPNDDENLSLPAE